MTGSSSQRFSDWGEGEGRRVEGSGRAYYWKLCKRGFSAPQLPERERGLGDVELQ